jgi:hypothetical protein
MYAKGTCLVLLAMVLGCGGARGRDSRRARVDSEIARTYGEAAAGRGTADLECTTVEYDYLGAGGVRVYGCAVALTYTCTTTIVSQRHDVVCVPQGQPRPYTAPAPSSAASDAADGIGLRELVAPCQLALGTHVSFYIGVEGDILELDVPGATDDQRACVETAIERAAIPAGADAQHFAIDVAPPAPPAASAPAARDGIEASVRASIDGVHAAIVACAGGGTVAVVGEWTADGALTVRLPDARVGTPEDGCVRAAAAGLRVDPAPGSVGAVLHAVQ